MIDNATIYPSKVTRAGLSIVKKPARLRDRIDQKKNYLLVKRVADILFASFFILCILSWLTPVIILLIKMDSRGPAFFLQKRTGRGGKSFVCFKFRTMVINADADNKQAEEYDTRLTGMGLFLRMSNIDEFPQFLNVLMGSMSIVGPRPHMYADCKKFSLLVPEYKSRNMVKPGLTGLAQVKGYHGLTQTRESVLLRYHWDRYYVNNISFVLDAKIIWKTALQRIAVLMRYGIQKLLPKQWAGF